jgi:hypothetical protein
MDGHYREINFHYKTRGLINSPNLPEHYHFVINALNPSRIPPDLPGSLLISFSPDLL